MKFAIVLLCLLVPGVTYAGEGPDAIEPPTSDRPWAEGVSKDDQTKAESLFTEATNLLKDAFFSRAVELYRQALTHWDHPAIHFNLAKALMNLDQPAAAYVHLKDSMKFGGQPLDAEQLEQVERYTKLLYETELAELVIETQEPGAKVSIDGVEILTGPGRWVGVVQPEKTRTILATKLGYRTEQIQPVLIKGQVNEILIEMVVTDVEMVRPFSNVIPWVVIGTGVAILGGGGVMTWQSQEMFNEYDAGVTQCNADSPFSFVDDTGRTITSPGTVGQCVPPASVTDKKDQGELFNTLSLVAYITGGVTLATGIVLLIVNRERPAAEPPPSFTVLPFIGPENAGVSATISF